MSQFYNHPPNILLDVWDPLNSEHDIIDQTSADHIKIMSPYILYWKIDAQKTRLNNDDLSNLYMETDERVFLNIEKPIQIYAYLEYSPIINELSKIGVVQTKDINFISNINDLDERLGRKPLSGDILRSSIMNLEGKKDNTFYTIVSVTETDMNLFRYTHYLLNAEATNLSDVPKKIKDFLDII